MSHPSRHVLVLSANPDDSQFRRQKKSTFGFNFPGYRRWSSGLMSFQQFRLGAMQCVQSAPHLQQQSLPTNGNVETTANPVATLAQPNPSATRLPYGAGDTDDGYTLVFPNLDAFQKWREQEEEANVVEFVKGDTHGSKAVPPRFKDHTKLVCARHSRSGRKKYVKKHPERVRKVPSRKVRRSAFGDHSHVKQWIRKLEGQGCPASISFKTYFNTDEVRACCKISPPIATDIVRRSFTLPDNSQHSHEVGAANFPFTRRGRRARLEREGTNTQKAANAASTSACSDPPIIASTSSSPLAPTTRPSPLDFSSAVSMIAPLPNVFASSPHLYVPQHYPPPDHPVSPSISGAQERWERMTILYNAIREHARGFQYPGPSVTALESILIRLYLESPIGNAPSSSLDGGITASVSQGHTVLNGFTAGESNSATGS